MHNIFKTVFELSINSSWLILILILIRPLLNRLSFTTLKLLWACAALRLCLPLYFQTKVSVIPRYSVIHSQAASAQATASSYAAQPGTDIIDILGFIWLAGIILIFSYMITSGLRLRRKTRESLTISDSIKLCDRINTPFVVGIFRPTIFIPSSVSEEDRKYVIFHERAHIKSHDNIIKPLGFVILCIHWFNPLVWLSYVLFSKDLELACDENSVRTLSKSEKKNYSTALLNCASGELAVIACPFAIGEHSVKKRIKRVLSSKRKTKIGGALAVVICAAAVIMFTTNASVNEKPQTASIDAIKPNPQKADVAYYTVPHHTVPPDQKPTESIVTEPESVTAEPAISKAQEETEYINENNGEENEYEYNYNDSSYSQNDYSNEADNSPIEIHEFTYDNEEYVNIYDNISNRVNKNFEQDPFYQIKDSFKWD